jgi:hypothetical protein
MRRRTGRRSAFLLIVLVTTAGVIVAGALKYEPPFYVAAERAAASVDLATQSSRLMTRVQGLANDVATKPEWNATFEADELNCFLEEYARELDERLGGTAHAPRVAINGDRISLGVRMGSGLCSSVVWVELRAWLVRVEPNCLAVEIESIRAGAIPVAGQSILDRVSEVARGSHVDVTWYRHGGKPVGLFRFFTDQGRRTTKQLRAVRVEDGQLRIAGRTATDAVGVPAAGPSYGPIE